MPTSNGRTSGSGYQATIIVGKTIEFQWLQEIEFNLIIHIYEIEWGEREKEWSNETNKHFCLMGEQTDPRKGNEPEFGFQNQN